MNPTTPMRAALISVATAAVLASVALAGSPWPPEASTRAASVLAKMNITNKLALLHGYGGGYVGDVPAMAEFGLPPINLEDGPQGVCTCWGRPLARVSRPLRVCTVHCSAVWWVCVAWVCGQASRTA